MYMAKSTAYNANVEHLCVQAQCTDFTEACPLHVLFVGLTNLRWEQLMAI